jgi:hypothetical protein
MVRCPFGPALECDCNAYVFRVRFSVDLNDDRPNIIRWTHIGGNSTTSTGGTYRTLTNAYTTHDNTYET